jgi:serine-type D-Ala-D-Ala carboxypeptidase (penicillin-binding protein 5/6)
MRARMTAAAVAACFAVTTGGLGVAAGSLAQASPAAGVVGGQLLQSSGVVVHPLPGAPPLPAASQLPASSWLVSDLDTGQVLAAKDPHGRFLPASTLKVLTAVTLLPRLDPAATFTATYRDATVDGSRVGLVPGMSYTISKLFTCMLVVSANDAADALAQANGGIHATVAEMNTEARRLQAYDTTARTPSGLDGPGESTSAYDLALIARAALAMPAFRHYVGTIRSTVPAPHHKHFAIFTHNYLLTTYRGDIGVKNGYTDAARGTYIGAATRGGHTILITLMHANPDFWPMATDLLNWGFKAEGKVESVGQLVSPASTKPKTVLAAAHQAPAQRHHNATRSSGADSARTALIAVVVVAIVGLVAFAGLVRRRRPPRYRSKLKLPPI